LLVESDFETELVAFGIAADGAIAISTANGVRTATVEIEPDGAVISVVVTDEATREVARVVTQPSLAEVARELERAA
jgi:hypothetical protein